MQRGGHRGGRGGGRGGRSEGGAGRDSGDSESIARAPRVDAATIKYLTTLAESLDNAKLAELDADEREALVGNGLREIADKPGVFREGTSSRVVQKLLSHSTDEQLRSMGRLLEKDLAALSVHVNGSHVLQSFLRACPAAIAREMEAGITDLPDSFENILLSMSKAFRASVHDLCFDPTGGPVMRTLVNVLAGLHVDTMAPRTRQLDLPSRLLAEADKPAPADPNLPASFGAELDALAAAMIEDATDEELDGMCSDHKACSLVQLFLVVGKKRKSLLDMVLARLLGPLINGQLADESAGVLAAMASHEVGSHLLEKIVEMAPPEIWFAIFQAVFRGKLAQLVTDRFANHVVSTLICSAKRPQHLELILDELRPHFDSLMNNQRGLVVLSMLVAAWRVHAQHKSLLQLVCKALRAQGNHERKQLVRLLAYMTPFDQLREDVPPPSRVGSLIAQALLRFPEAECKVVADSLAACAPTELVRWSKDASASRIIEACLASAASLPLKQRVIALLKGHFGELAQDKFGSHTLDSAWLHADVAMRETIAEELLAREGILRDSTYGRIALRNCKVDAYKAKREDWVDRERSIARKKDMFADIIGSGDAAVPAGSTPAEAAIAQLRAERDDNMTALGFSSAGGAIATPKAKGKKAKPAKADDDDEAARALTLDGEKRPEESATSALEIESLFKQRRKRDRTAAAAAPKEEEEEEAEAPAAPAHNDDVMKDVLDALSHSKRRRKTKAAADGDSDSDGEEKKTPKKAAKKKFTMH